MGKKKNIAKEALESADKIITRVKMKGGKVSDAKKLYEQAEAFFEEKNYEEAIEFAEKAEKKVKSTYVKHFKKKVEKNIELLKKEINEMNAAGMETKRPDFILDKSQALLEKKKLKYIKQAEKIVKIGLKKTNEGLKDLESIKECIISTNSIIRDIKEYGIEIDIIEKYENDVNKLKELFKTGNFEEAGPKAKILRKETDALKARSKRVLESISSLHKLISDADILGVNIGDRSERLSNIEGMVKVGKFKEAYDVSETQQIVIKKIIEEFKKAKIHVDQAEVAISRAKGWGFSPSDAQEKLGNAKDALCRNAFEKAIEMANLAKESASNVREEHKLTLDLIQETKEKLDEILTTTLDTSKIKDLIKDAEDEFNSGNYRSSNTRIREAREIIELLINR